MNSVTSILFDQTVPIFGYQVNIGQALATTLVVGTVAVCAIKKMCFSSAYQPLQLSDKEFWERIEEIPTLMDVNTPITLGNTTFENLADAHRQMALSCTKTSDYVLKYLIQSDFQGTVLDLGCGIGANASPLVAKGCQVILIDKLNDAIETYNRNKASLFVLNTILKGDQLHKATSMVGDITQVEYPNDVDAVICVDTLPYLRPTQLSATLEKIFQALRPGGIFVGTIFFKPNQRDNFLTKAMSKIGAHFYPNRSFAHEIITRSGFQITSESERSTGILCWKTSMCLEFLAEKPNTHED